MSEIGVIMKLLNCVVLQAAEEFVAFVYWLKELYVHVII